MSFKPARIPCISPAWQLRVPADANNPMLMLLTAAASRITVYRVHAVPQICHCNISVAALSSGCMCLVARDMCIAG